VAIVIGLSGWVATLRVRNERLVAALEEQSAANTVAGRRADEQASEIARLEERLGLVTQPALNVPIVDLDPDREARGDASARVVTVRSGALWLTLVITVRNHPPASQYDVEVTGDDGRTVWKGAGLERSAYGTFTLVVPKSLLENGVSHVRVFARRQNRRELLHDYAIRVETR
jgi:hypothetical protein